MSDFADVYPRRLEWGRVFRGTAGVIGREPLLILGFGVLLGAVPSILSSFLIGARTSAGAIGVLGSPFYWLQLVFNILFASFMQAALFQVIFQALGGRRANLGEVLANSAKFFLPLFAVNLGYSVAVAIGFVLLIVPGVMMALAWCVAAPALIAERTGITQVFGRSAQLTRNHRWSILGLAVIAFVALMILEGVLFAVGLRAGVGAVTSAVGSPVGIIVAGIVSGLFQAAAASVIAVLYAELRSLKDGVASESLAEVFD